MIARLSDILGTLGLWPLRAAPASGRRGVQAAGPLSCRGVGMPSVLTFPSRMEPLAEGSSGRKKALDV
ncbi:hypothetical protein [Thioalkalivibrio sp. ALE30]|uniref:hypothetical protein n=1 Tax=Thioalkalivibrio sp. ALE30 TaxID=1158181 RepID=UPI0009DA02B4|nr:hypothetical protein [Thioalkalivibrio sp. ALE30]